MIAPACEHRRKRRYGKDRKGRQRFKCLVCGSVYTEAEPNLLGGMYIDMDRAQLILNMLVEGSSVRAVSRLTNTDPHTVIKVMVLVGSRCKRYMEDTFRNLIVGRVQVDEVWQFIYCKQKTADTWHYGEEVGDSYCFTALERDSKLLFAWHLGKRTGWHAEQFLGKLTRAISGGRFQLSSDAFIPYTNAVARRLSGRVDYAQVIKIFKSESKEDQRKYSPAKIAECEKRVIFGVPKHEDVSTSHVERHNLSLRTCLRRMTRLSLGFSKKWANHEAAVALFMAHYNFCRIHGTLKTTPAVAHGLTAAPWSMLDLLKNTANK